MFFQTEGDRGTTQYVIGISIFAALLLFCCTLQCYICQRLRRKRRHDEHFEPLHYPSSTLQFVRFNHRREPKMGTIKLDIPCGDQQ